MRSGVGRHRASRGVALVSLVAAFVAMLSSLTPALALAATGDAGSTTSSLAAQSALPSITIDVKECAPTTGTWDDAQARSWDDLSASCAQARAGVTTHLTPAATGQDEAKASDASGRIAYDSLQPGDYTIYTDIPRGTAWEVVYCSVDGGAPYQKTFDESIVTTFAGLESEQVVCTWFVIPVEADVATATASATATAVATATTPPVEPTTPGETPDATATEAGSIAQGGVITVDTFTCPTGTGLDASSAFADLNAACTTAAPDVTVHLSDPATGNDVPQGTGSGGLLTWEGLDPGTYTAWTDIPRGTAQEVLYCSNLAGDIAPVGFNENVVATLQLAEGERFDCSWFILPASASGAEDATATATATVAPTETPAPTETVVPTEPGGTSLTVHLSLCPQDYAGSDYYTDCHANGIDGMEFLLDGPDGQVSETTTLPETPGPGVVTFDGLSGGDYTLAGGPPGDFGHVVLFCSTQPDGTEIPAPVEGAQASLTVDAGESVLCDWYYIPENLQGETPTPTATTTPVPTGTTAPTPSPTATEAARAAIVVTLYTCPAPAAGSTYGGATYDQLTGSCGTTVDGVPFSLGDVGAPPLVANTGVSGPGAVRFYDLLPADYTLSPTLPSGMTSTAVFCTIDGGDRYQKALQNGGVTFVNVESDQIACDWFAVSAPEPTPTQTPPTVTAEPSQPTPTTAARPSTTATPAGPTGSITVREYLCAKDKSAITDWERECTPGSSGATFLLTNSDLRVNTKGTTAKNGVLTFPRLKDGHYTLKQESGAWCRATADRVDSESRVIVADGANTDVVIYQCNATTSLPSTGTGTQISSNDRDTVVTFAVLALVLVSAALATMSVTTFIRTERNRRRVIDHREAGTVPVRTESGRMRMRFR